MYDPACGYSMVLGHTNEYIKYVQTVPVFSIIFSKIINE